MASEFEDEQLAETAAIAADLLRNLAVRWRFRVRAGRLGNHPLDETLRLIAVLESAAGLMDQRAPASSPVVPEAVANLRDGEERYRVLVDSVEDHAIYMLDADGTVASWNSGAERIKGWRAEEIIGKHFSIFYPPEDVVAGKPDRELEIAIQEGRYAEEGWRVRKDGERFWANVTITALRDRRGRLVRFAKVTRDVTQLRAAMEALRQSEERLRLMIEAVRDYAIFVLDPDGRIASWNLGAERLKGYRADEAIGQHFSIFYTEDDRRRGHPEDELRRARAEGRYEEEGWRVRKDGTRFWANVVITAVRDQEGRHIGFTKVTRDVTEARAFRDAQVAIQVRDEFIAIVGHELRTPLAGLLLHIESLQRTALPDDSAPRLRQRLAKAAAVGQRLELLISRMLDVSRITAGRLTLEPELTSLDELVAEVVDRFTDQAQISMHLEPGVNGFWDRMRIEQVVSNLVSNAIKYGRGKPIVVEVRRDGGQAILRVADRGIGVAPEHQKRIFERFERAVATRDYGGFGLGLWITRQVVEANGGRIGVESKPGEGAIFTVTLPLERPKEPHAPH